MIERKYPLLVSCEKCGAFTKIRPNYNRVYCKCGKIVVDDGETTENATIIDFPKR